MSCTLIQRADHPTQFDNASGHVLQATVRPDSPVRLRRNRVMASVGPIEYSHEGDDGRPRTPLHRLRSKTKLSTLTAGDLELQLATGEGTAYLGHEGGDVAVLELVDDELVVLDQTAVLAYSDSIVSSLEPVVGSDLGFIVDARHAWVLTGSGEIATATPGEVVILDLDGVQPVEVEAEALLARTGGVQLAKASSYVGRLAARTAGQALQVVSGDDVKRGRVWLGASGVGQILIRSSD